MEKKWWKEGIIYQIYPRSFCDKNGDGVGDLRGIISKLDYLKELGVDIIWLSPIYKSPNDDNGYDISDYRDIMDEFGTLSDFDVLLEGVHERGMRLLMDLVVNHSSDEHFWFEEAKKSTDNPYRDYYYWKKPVNGEVPNNWKSFFGGSVWEWHEETQEYFLHLFTKKQPDLNWENPKLREEVYDLMRFWLDKGVDGFRMDVFTLFSKRLAFEDADMSDFTQVIRDVYANGPRIHEFLHEMNQEVFQHYDSVSIGEGVGITHDKILDYVDENRKEIDMIFHFDHMFMDHGKGGRFDPEPWSSEAFFQIFFDWNQALEQNGWGSIYLGNHDFPRMVSRFGDDESFWKESAKLLATLIMTLRGTPTVYQGDEIGMKNVPFARAEDHRDIEFHNAYKEKKEKSEDLEEFLEIARSQARDHARTPIQWSGEAHAGFSETTPWIQVHPDFPSINVEEQSKDPDSILSFYKSLIQFRKAHPIWAYGSLSRIASGNPSILAYERNWEGETRRVIMNFSSQAQQHNLEGPGWEVQLNTYSQSSTELPAELRPWEGLVLLASKT